MPFPLSFLFVLLLAVHAAQATAADVGIYTLVDGEARVLRGVSWHGLAPGVRIENGDIVDAGNAADVQLEWTSDAIVAIDGPAQVYVVPPPAGDEGKTPVELIVTHGWLKAAVPAGKRALRLRLPSVALEISAGVVVVHGDAKLAELFVETGGAQMRVPVGRGKEAPPREVKAGEYASRAADGAFTASASAPSAFVSAMPRGFRDSLPALSPRFPAASVATPLGRDVTLAEAEPWLAGPARRTFVRRFTARLSDPAFRAAVAARPAAYPEWDRILHPEKYAPPAAAAK